MPPKPPLGTRLAIVALAAFFAVLLPWEWIDYSDKALHIDNALNFHPLAIVLYAPLAFGVIWPVVIFVLVRADADHLAWPKKTALILFCVCSFFSVPIVMAEASHLSSGLEEIRLNEIALRKQAEEFSNAKRHAELMLETKGVDAFHEPLTDAESSALVGYLREHPVTPADCLTVVRKYPTAVDPMERLARSTACSPEALDAILDNVIQLQKQTWRSINFVPSDLAVAIAQNPKASPALLKRLLELPKLWAQQAATKNPNLPKAEKVAFLRRCADSAELSCQKFAAEEPDTPTEVLVKLLDSGNTSVSGAVDNPKVPDSAKTAYVRKLAMSQDVSWRMWAAGNPYCPLDDLKRLAADPATAPYAASNPKLPTDLLEPLTHSQDQNIRNRALRNLEQRSHP